MRDAWVAYTYQKSLGNYDPELEAIMLGWARQAEELELLRDQFQDFQD
jgi:hypothetical protein